MYQPNQHNQLFRGFMKMAIEGIKLIRDFREKRDAIANRLDELRGHL